MRTRLPRLILAGLASLGLATSFPTVAPAAEPDVEVLARGPVHEAFAATLEVQKDAVLVRQAPPDAIEELPPDQKPEGDNVQWVPGYWHWDEEREDFIWISGFWRVPPPGRVWVPGSWREVRNGFQWVHGFWQESTPEITRADVEYLTQPPAPLDLAPSIPAPSETHIHVPGCWVWRSHRYVWRPGFWVDHRPGWVWVPAHYRWTPAGHIFIDGYWDMPLAERGVLFAPVYVPRAVYARPSYFYTPTIVVSEPALYTSLFVRRGWGCYYFGDYFENRYVNRGFSAWAVGIGGSGFGVSVSVGRSVGYDPLWDYYRVANRNDRFWAANINNTYVGRFNGTVARPPRTLVQQNVIVNNVTNNVTNVTNNNTVIVNNNNTVNNNQMMLTSLTNVAATNKAIALKPIQQEQRVREQQFAKELRQVSAQRKQLETSLVDRGQVPVKGNDAPKAVKLDVPKAAVVRAQVAAPTAKANPVPPPASTLIGKPNAANNNAALKPAPKPAPLTPTPPTAGQKPEPTKPNTPAPMPTKPTTPTTPAPSPDPKPLPPSPKPNTPAPTPKPEPKPLPPTTPPATKPVNPTPPVPTPAPRPLNPAPQPPAPKPTAPANPTPPAAKPMTTPPAAKPTTPAPNPKPPTNPKGFDAPAPQTTRSLPPPPAPQRIDPRPAPAPVSRPAPPPTSFKPSSPPPSFKPSAPPPSSFKPSAPPAPVSKPSAPPPPSSKPSSPPPSSKPSEKSEKPGKGKKG